MSGLGQGGEIILEIQRVGKFLRVAAVDTLSLKEVVFMAPANASKLQIQTLAKQKLAYIKKKSESGI
jgi:hypothetical protein